MKNSAFLLLVAANAVPSSLNPLILTMGAIRSSVMYVLTRATRRHIPEDGILLYLLLKLSTLFNSRTEFNQQINISGFKCAFFSSRHMSEPSLSYILVIQNWRY
jgi:hypothetical protein